LNDPSAICAEELQQGLRPLGKDGELSPYGGNIVVGTARAIAARVCGDSFHYRFGRTLKMDDGTNIQNSGHGLRLTDMARQAVQNDQGVRRRPGTRQKPSQNPLGDEKVLVFQ